MKIHNISFTFHFLVFLIIVLFSREIISQWKVINPTPLIDNSYVSYADSENCNVITQRANLVSSSDGGIIWNYFYSDVIKDINKAFFIDKNNGWATSGSSTLKTTDGGVTWEDKGNILIFANFDIYFSDSLNGWSVGNKYIKSTTDGGETWSTNTLSNGPQLTFVSQYNDSVLFTGGFDDLFKSTDGGVSWNIVPNPIEFPDYRKFRKGEMNDTTIGFLLGNSSIIFKTTNEGDSWDLIFPDNFYYYVSDLSFNSNLLIACGKDFVLRSTDIGETWDSVDVPQGSYNTIYFATDSIIYISGENGALIKSTDRGNSFSTITRTFISEHINSVSVSDSIHGFITTWYTEKVFKTTDGGDSFVDITPPNFLDANNKIYAISNNMAVATSDIKIFTTKNGGLTWNVSSYGTGNMYVPNDIYFKDTLNGMAGCYWNLMRETTNGGDTWINRFFGDTAQLHILSISFADEQNGFFTTGDKLFKTTNGGLEWNYFQYLDPGLVRIKFVDLLNGVAGSYDGLYYTTDGGANWSRCDSINNYYDFDLKKNDTGSVLMALTFDYLYTSFDLGRTWKKERIPFADLIHITMSDPATAWLSGYFGHIAKYNDPSIPLDVKTNYELKNFELLQNYPNPFNPSTQIRYTILRTEKVSLKIYNILGQEIKTLFEGENNPGTYTVKWNGNNNSNNKVTSGIYLCRIIAGTSSKIIKMLLLK